MNQKYHKLLHYVLIILLMFSPLRGAFAMESSHCDMAGGMDMSVQSSSGFIRSSNDLNSNQIYQYQTHQQIDQAAEQMDNDCCCCDDSCNSNCDMRTTVSLLMQVSSYSPVFINTGNIFISSPELQLRALTPPSRPPLVIS